MRKSIVCLVGLLLTSSPALAQIGGGGGGGGGRGGEGRGASGAGEIDSDPGSSNSIGSHDHPREMKPIARKQFDKAVTAMFAQGDLNHDGMVTLAELQSVIDGRRDAVVRARFKEIDANHDGAVTIGEFVAWEQKLGSAAVAACSVVAGSVELVPETLGPALGDSERDEALAFAIEPLSATMITRANVHYRPGASLEDVLAIENARFDAADTNHDGFLVQSEIAALRHAGDKHGVGRHPHGDAPSD